MAPACPCLKGENEGKFSLVVKTWQSSLDQVLKLGAGIQTKSCTKLHENDFFINA